MTQDAHTQVRRFQIIEQHDGRYLVIMPPYPTSMGWEAKGETILGWEDDCRSHVKAYAEIADFMVGSGEYLDYATQIEHIRYPA